MIRYSLLHRCVCLVWMMPFISLLNICSTTSTNFDNIFCFQFSLFSSLKNEHYKKSWLFRRPTWPKCPHWPNGMSILTKGLDMKNTCYILPIHLTKVTFLTKCQIENLIKIDKCPSKWALFNQIGHLDLTFNQIDHYKLTLVK